MAKFFTQEKGIDYDVVFSPVNKFETVFFLMFIMAYLSLYLQKVEIKTAFLYGRLDEELYMQPLKISRHLWNKFNVERWKNKVCKFLRALHGPKQASKSC